MENEYISEELDEWQQIPSPNSIDKAQWINENNETLVIKDEIFSVSSVFPPTNHEDLPITTSQEPLYSISLSSSSSSSSSPHEDEEDEEEIESGGKWRRMVVVARIFRLIKAAREIMKNYAACRIRLWSSIFATTGVFSMVIISLWCMRVQKWRNRVQMEKIQLFMLLNEREQKINQLLLQISHMNEMLLTRRSVPVLRIS